MIGKYAQRPEKLWRYIVSTALVLVCTFFVPVYAKAESAISQGYQTTSNNISAGSLVGVLKTGGNVVNPANSSNVSNLAGVAVNKPLLELSNSSANNVQVAVSGSVPALVSDINGTVNVGDKITASPVNGIGMKALGSTEIVGTAQEGLNSIHTVQEKLTKQDGSQATIKVGMLPIEVNVAYYTAPQRQGSPSSFLPPFLQSLANSISGQQVSPFRVLLGFLALILGFVASMVMLYASVRSNIVSIGRNPLARGALHRSFIDVVLVAIGVLIITLSATFIILSS